MNIQEKQLAFNKQQEENKKQFIAEVVKELFAKNVDVIVQTEESYVARLAKKFKAFKM